MLRDRDKFEDLFKELSGITGSTKESIKSAEILVHLLHEYAYRIINECPQGAYLYGEKLVRADNLLQRLYANKIVHGNIIPPKKEVLG